MFRGEIRSIAIGKGKEGDDKGQQKETKQDDCGMTVDDIERRDKDAEPAMF